MIIARVGEKVTCTNGHVICQIVKQLEWGTVGWMDCFGAWRQNDQPKIGSTYKPKCVICGAPFISEEGWDFHFQEGGWRHAEPQLFKCTERFLDGRFGRVAFMPQLATDPSAWAIVGAGERINPGDLITLRDGYAYRWRPDDKLEVLGRAATSNSRTPRK